MNSESKESQIDRAYRQLRTDVDRQVASFVAIHSPNLTCAKGCDTCCSRISIHRGELHLIRNSLLQVKVTPPSRGRDANRCIFLLRGACTIYEHRPILCRVHGLPLLYPIREYDANGLEIDTNATATHWCDLNFTAVSTDHQFPIGTTVDMGEIERRLVEIDLLAADDRGDAVLVESELVEFNTIFDRLT